MASLFSLKARQWLQGRKGQWEKMETAGRNKNKVVWFHCASLGEFEQGRPLIEKCRTEFPDNKILLTFFSPSGYNVKKQYPGADYIFYLPLDTPGNVNRFLEIWDPVIAVFVKYEFWFNYIHKLHARNIPAVVVSAIFRQQQHFFRPYGKWPLRQLKKITWFFVQNTPSMELLQQHGVKNVSVSGDTRFDRVFQIKEAPIAFPVVEEFSRGEDVLVAGSTWPKDEELLLPLINENIPGLKFIIAPHEINPSHINQLRKSITVPVAVFSEIKNGIPENCRVLIIDGIGILSHLYQYGSMAYIGGGFGKGIHNILEAATFGLPVFFGPEYRKFAEAQDLVVAGGAFPVNNAEELHQKINLFLKDKDEKSKASAICSSYVKQKKGATDIIIDYLGNLISGAKN